MAQTLQVQIGARDNTGNAFSSVQGKLGSIAKSVGALATMEIASKIIGGFKAIGEAAGKVDATSKKNFESLGNIVSGATAELGKMVFGNRDLMASIRSLLAAVVPLVSGFVKGLVPALTWVVNGVVKFMDAIRPAAEFLWSLIIPAFSKLATVVTIVGKAWELAFAHVTSNKGKVADLKDELKGLWDDLKTFERAKVSFKPANLKPLEAQGARVNAKEGKPDKPVDLEKQNNERFNQLLKLREANKLEAAGIDELSVLYANYSFTLRNSNADLNDRATALEAVTAYGKLATDAAERENKALEEQAKRLDELVKREETRLDSLTKLVKLQGASASQKDRNMLGNEREALLSDLDMAKDPTMRLALSEQIAAIDDALKVEVSKLEESLGSTLGNALEGGLTRAFSGDFSGLIGSWFSGIAKGIASGFAHITATALQKTGIFVAFQSKLLLAYSKIMSVVSAALSTPWGWAAVAAGAIALGSLVRGFSSSGRAANGGSAYMAASGFSSSAQNDISDARGQATIVIQGGLLDMSNPEQARSLADAIGELTNRRVLIQRG